MQAPEAFLLEYFSVRNALYERFQRETEAFEREFCHDFRIGDPRIYDYSGEHVLDVAADDGCVKLITNGYNKGKAGCRLRYVLIRAEQQWFISDLERECSICKGAAGHLLKPQLCEAGPGTGNGPDLPRECPVCKSTGWVSSKQASEYLLSEQ